MYTTADPAAWHDWLTAVAKVTPKEEISETEAGEAMLVLLREYHHGFDLREVIEHFTFTA